jgi:hypothetical protein
MPGYEMYVEDMRNGGALNAEICNQKRQLRIILGRNRGVVTVETI